MTSSAIPAVQDALLARFEAAQAEVDSPLEGVAIDHGRIDPRQEEMVQIFDADSERDWRGLGNQPSPMDEEIKIDVVVEVLRAQGTAWGPARTRAWAIVAALEDAFRADIKLGGTWRNGKVSRVRQRYFREDRTSGARVFLTFAGVVRI